MQEETTNEGKTETRTRAKKRKLSKKEGAARDLKVSIRVVVQVGSRLVGLVLGEVLVLDRGVVDVEGWVVEEFVSFGAVGSFVLKREIKEGRKEKSAKRGREGGKTQGA